MSKILIKNIRYLLGVYDTSPNMICGNQMAQLPVWENAWLAIEDGLIADYGYMSDWPGISDWRDLEVIDADGKTVLPGWCDSHTHTVFAAPRATEFVDRINGLTYEQIAARGGGILNSAAALQSASEDQLYQSAFLRLNEMLAHGTVAAEIKSGYGLTVDAELKMLQVIQRLKDNHPITIKSTLLAAHAIPVEYKDNPDGWVNKVIQDLIPQAAERGLADYIDVFCETNYFNVEQTDRILEAAAKFGLQAKIHVNQFTTIGGVEVAVKNGALSVDHLELLTEKDLSVLKGSACMPVALPGCSFFIQIPYTPARTIIREGLPLALASDFNPGSTPSGNMNFVNSLACIYMKMTPEEVIHASTLNGAYAMGLSNSHGTITPGKKADIIITKPMNHWYEMPYYYGENPIEQIIIGGHKHEAKSF
jgi:imidazolonepropionase